MKIIYLVIFIYVLPLKCLAQYEFVIDKGEKQFKVPFEKVNNLVIIPVELNGVALSFLLDTGVNSTLLFSLPEEETMVLNNSGKIHFKGMGTEKPIVGFKSIKNSIRIGKATNTNLTIYTVYDKDIGLSNRMGIPIHGIIGNDFFKDFVVDINFHRNLIKIHNPRYYKSRKCRRCEDFEISFYKNKPYIKLIAELSDEVSREVNLLIDSGSSEAMWLFKDSKKGIEIPKDNFSDFLGLSLNGGIYGSRSRIKALRIGKFELEKITTSFPDSIYTKGIKSFRKRDGSLGGQFLNRFRVVINYEEKKLLLKPNRRFNDPFNYDMSGVTVARKGFEFIEEQTIEKDRYNEEFVSVGRSGFSLEPSYVIAEVRSFSPGEDAGLLVGDIIKTICGKSAYKYSLQEIISLLSSEDGRKITLKVERNGNKIPVDFKLKKKL